MTLGTRERLHPATRVITWDWILGTFPMQRAITDKLPAIPFNNNDPRKS
jgi:hypothetical protein